MLSKNKSVLCLALIIGLMLLSSCSDKSTDPKESALIGTWTLQHFYLNDVEQTLPYNMTLTFHEDDTYTVVMTNGGTETDDGTYSVSGSTMTIDGQPVEYSITGSRLSGYTLTMIFDMDSVEGKYIFTR